MDSRDEAEARQKVRELMAQPPQQRPNEFVNPLEKIEQLLTCPICLDRYKQPKLLPCQHTFCYPCLESCADTLHRTLKCPECRAEHNIPYEGVKAFQPNYTLTGFLDIHLQATPESAAEIEEYVHRYNLERCKVCDEKADCELCAHCERKACKDCRNQHMEMLKRDMGRLLNQVRRLSNRIIEASDGLSKGLELLNLNCETSKDEVKEYFHRHIRDLKKKEEFYIAEIETWAATEVRLMSNLRDVLEIESSNMSEAVARLDAAIKGECTLDDTEMVKLKNTFSEGIEYLRNFQPDAEELFNRKIRFSPGEDAAKLPQAILTAGDLTVLHPQFSGRYLALEQSYVPRPFTLPLESDHYRGREERNNIRDRPTSRHSWNENYDYRRQRYGGGGGADWDSTHRDALADDSSIRYRRRTHIEEEAFRRVRGEPSNSNRSPWYRDPEASSLNATPDSSRNLTPATPESGKSVSPQEKKPPMAPSTRKEERTPALPASTRSNGRASMENGASYQNGLGSSLYDRQLATTPTPTLISAVTPLLQSIIPSERREDPVALSSRPHRKPPLPRQQSSNDDSLNEKVENIKRAHAERQAASLAPSRAASESEESDEETPRATPRSRPRIRIVCRAASVTGDDESSRIQVQEDARDLGGGTPIPVTHFSGEEDSGGYVGERTASAVPATPQSPTAAAADDSPPAIPAWLARRRQRFQRSRTNPDLQANFCSQRVQQLLQERCSRLDSTSGPPSPAINGASAEDATPDIRTKLRRRSASRDAGEWRARGRPRVIFGRKGGKEGELNWPRGVCTMPGGQIVVCDSSNHRICVFDREGKHIRSFGGYGNGRGQLDSAAGVTFGKQRLYVTDRYNHRVCVFDTDGVFLSAFGGHGQGNGKFNNPWGAAIDDLGTVYVVDKDNHRVQMFDKNGQFIGKFGSIGHGPGQMNSPLFVAFSRLNHQVYVSDSSNHRICVFDAHGHYIFCFGTEGFHGGQFKFPRGIAIDNQSNVLVADSGNNRIQVFSLDGEYISTFGSWGAGAGQLKGVEDLCVFDGGIIASDRENHRIQIF